MNIHNIKAEENLSTSESKMSETKTEPGFIDFLSEHVQYLRGLESTLIESNKNLEEAIKNMENKRNFKKKVYIKILIIYFMTKMAKKTS